MTPRIPIRTAICLVLLFCWLGTATQEAISQDTQAQLVDASSTSASVSSSSATEAPARRRVQAGRLDESISVDGRLDDPAWQQAPTIEDFKQRDPDEGHEPTERTVVRVLFDNEALYVGARMYDATPDSIVARLGRRDAQLESDAFGFFVDPYLDRRTGYYFAINAAGTLMDGVLMNDDWDDDSWDGIWQGKATIDDEGWTAELRIPYSQLRFHEKEIYTWGVNFRRDIARKNERIFLEYTPRNESGFVSRFPDLVGIEQIRPPRQLEVTPYVTAQADYRQAITGDPFNSGSQYTPGFGADFKAGLTSNLTLNATVNPDFGQVEVDPAVVNLSDFETFFPERRPFFIEGASIFSFGRGGANNNWGFNWGNPNFFYSRRIGRSPQGSLPDHDYADRPTNTRILGAAKLTGKVQNWNVGTVQSFTASEKARLQREDIQFNAEVEPFAYYGVFRAQNEIQEGRHALGFISTAAVRDFRDDRLRDEINSHAYTFGVDGWTFLDKDKTWVVTGWMGGSHVRGTTERMIRLQRSSQHYFQRPDASHIRVDSSATSLSGMSGRVMLNKQRGNFTTNAAFGFVTPSFNVNDLGFQRRGDVLNGHVVASYQWTEPKGIYRRMRVNTALFRSADFEGNTTWTGLFGNGFILFKNYYAIYAGGAYNPETVNTRRTRGGPLTLNPPGWEVFTGVETDSRKPVVFELSGFSYRSGAGNDANISLEVEWKPAGNVSLSLEPQYGISQQMAQWVGSFEDPTATATYGRRYVFAELDQKTVSANIRLNWTFTPELSFQLFAQPLISAGDYSRYKELARPKSFDFIVYGEDNGSTIDENTLVADPDGSGALPPLELYDPSFNVKALRGTAVFRWEYRPGSTLYLVWTQSRDHFDNDGTFRFGRSVNRLFDAKPENIFMLKLTYWLSR